MPLLFFVLVIFILISHNIVLINEESLILSCFIIVVGILIYKFNYLIDSIFNKYTQNIKEDINSSFSYLRKKLEQVILLIKDKTFLNNVKLFQNHFLLFLHNFILWMSQKIISNINFFYSFWFISFKNLEYKIIKLIMVSLIFKLRQHLFLENFLTYNLFIKKFVGRNFINLKEWFCHKNIKKI